MRRGLLAAAFALLFAAPAHAAERPVSPPLPPNVPSIERIDKMPYGLGAFGYAFYDEETNTIFTESRLSRSGRLHEYGHAFAEQLMDDSERDEFRKLIGMSNRPWADYYDANWNIVTGVEEFFADEYMTCRMGLLPQPYKTSTGWAGEWIDGYGYAPPTNALQRRIARAMIGWALDTNA